MKVNYTKLGTAVVAWCTFEGYTFTATMAHITTEFTNPKASARSALWDEIYTIAFPYGEVGGSLSEFAKRALKEFDA